MSLSQKVTRHTVYKTPDSTCDGLQSHRPSSLETSTLQIKLEPKHEDFSQADIDHMIQRAWEIKRLYSQRHDPDQSTPPHVQAISRPNGSSGDLVQNTATAKGSGGLLMSLMGNPQVAQPDTTVIEAATRVRCEPLPMIKKEPTTNDSKPLSPGPANLIHPLGGYGEPQHIATTCDSDTSILDGPALWDPRAPGTPENNIFSQAYPFGRQRFANYCTPPSHPRHVSVLLGSPIGRLLHHPLGSNLFESQPLDDTRLASPIQTKVLAPFRLFRELCGLPGYLVLHILTRGSAPNLGSSDQPPSPSFPNNDTTGTHGTGNTSEGEASAPPESPTHESLVDDPQRHILFLHEAFKLGYLVTSVRPSPAALHAEHQFTEAHFIAPLIPIPLQYLEEECFLISSPGPGPSSEAPIRTHGGSLIYTPGAQAAANERSHATTSNHQFDGTNPDTSPTNVTSSRSSTRRSARLQTEIQNFPSSPGSGLSSNAPSDTLFTTFLATNTRTTRAETPFPTSAKSTRRASSSRKPCQECHKVFERPSLLNDHMHVHTNQKRHVCTHCGQLIAHRSNVKRHEKSRRCRDGRNRGTQNTYE